MSHVTFRIPALDCPDELAVLESGLRRVGGVQNLYPNYLTRSLQVEYDPRHAQPELLEQQIRQLGFEVHQQDAAATASQPTPPAWNLRAWTTGGGGILLVAAAAAWWLRSPQAVVDGLLIVSTAVSGLPVARAALRSLRLRTADMNLLMTTAAVGAMFTRYYSESAVAMFLFGVSLWLERYSLGRTRRAVAALLEVTPQVAHRIDPDGTLRTVAPADLAVGDRVLVKPGERIPIDGEVLSGQSAVNQSPITGESLPVEKQPGDPVFAGSLNGESSLEIRATQSAEQSTLAHITRLVELAQSRRSPTERFVDRFARHYTPLILVLAALVATVPPLLGYLGWDWFARVSPREWFHSGLVLLVIACPCALVISTPVTIVSGLYQATRLGILVKGGEHLENLGRLRAVVFDKTGTLTTGRAELVEIHPTDGADPAEVLRLAAALEQSSDHPFAEALVRAARAEGLELPAPGDLTALRGFGIRGVVDGTEYLVGSPRLFTEHASAANGQIVQLLSSVPQRDGALTAVVLGTRQRVLGLLLLADQPRPDAAAAVAGLRALGLSPIVMLTGDHRTAADQVARSVGIDEVHAQLLPQDKVRLVTELAGREPRLAMVGDGVNDAPALAAAQVGIALGRHASATALETADVIVLLPALRRLVDLVQLGRRCRRLLGVNIGLALSLKAAVLLLVLLAPQIATLWMAVAADVGASLLVILNGMRLIQRVGP